MKMPATPEARRKRLPLLRHSAHAHSTFGRQADWHKPVRVRKTEQFRLEIF